MPQLIVLRLALLSGMSTAGGTLRRFGVAEVFLVVWPLSTLVLPASVRGSVSSRSCVVFRPVRVLCPVRPYVPPGGSCLFVCIDRAQAVAARTLPHLHPVEL